jgi:hypothetical protein
LQNCQEESVISFDSLKLWRSMSTHWKDLEVNFLILPSAVWFGASSLAAEWFWCRLVKRSTVSLMSKFLCKTVSFYNISWCILCTVWKVIKLCFQRIWSHVTWMFLVGVMIKTLKTSQKPRRRAGTEDHFENA